VTRPALLDVNVLVALFDPDHIHHDAAHDWFAEYASDGWATCPLTELGFVRVLSNPAYGSEVNRPTDIVARLQQFCASQDHEFWPDEVSLVEEGLIDVSLIRGHRQLTDVYLLAIAAQNDGRLVTFDRTIPLSAVAGATEDMLVVLGA